MLDLAENQPTVDVLRDQGFLTGFGIDVGNPDEWGDEDDPRIVGHDITGGSEEGGRTAMENLLAIDPDINLVYTINEPAAAGARLALDAAGSDAAHRVDRRWVPGRAGRPGRPHRGDVDAVPAADGRARRRGDRHRRDPRRTPRASTSSTPAPC